MEQTGAKELFTFRGKFFGSPFRLENKEILTKIRERAITLIGGMDETTAKRFSNLVYKGIQEGYSHKKLTNELMRMSSKYSKMRANRIVRTETTAAIEYIKKQFATKNGMDVMQRNTTADEKVCPVC